MEPGRIVRHKDNEPQRTFQGEDIATILRIFEKIVGECSMIAEEIMNPMQTISIDDKHLEPFKDITESDND